MSVTKTYSLTIVYERATAGQKGTSPPRTRGPEEVDYEIAPLSESDHGYVELRKFVLARLNAVVPISQGENSAIISGEITES